jgi:DNA polymerase III delta subunit
MIYIVHGEDTSKSRGLIVNHHKKLQTDLATGVNRVNLDIKNTTPEQLYEQCISGSLFGESPLVVFDISDAKKGDLEAYVEKLSKIPDSTTLIIYSAKALTKTNAFIAAANKLKAKVIENSVYADANIFKFTDALYAKNRTQTYAELHKLNTQDYDPFYIASMILYGLRNLAKVAWQAPSVSKLKPFQLSKYHSTLRQYSAGILKDLYSYLYSLEKKSKTGQITPEMAVTLAIEKVLNS